MTPEEFFRRWGQTTLLESQGAQEHFRDLCRLLDEPSPAEGDPTGKSYCFERAVAIANGRSGRADVWKKDCFAWEYKGPGGNLDDAFTQLQRYAPALGNPPLLIASDMRRFRVHTNWTYVVSTVHEIGPADLLDPDKRLILKWAFREPDRLKPTRTRQALTEEAASRFAALAARLERRGHPLEVAARFLIRLVFCMFAESVGLLRDRLFSRMLERAAGRPERFAEQAGRLFAAMRTGGEIGFEEVRWFNGGLFKDATALPLEADDLAEVQAAAGLDWSDIDPAIMGTLFERGLTREGRDRLAREVARRNAAGKSEGAVGVHYTPPAIIERLIEPTITRPLRREWDTARGAIIAGLEKVGNGPPEARRRALREAERRYEAFLARLRTFRVLDPACGSGNFLYLALTALKDLEHTVLVEGEALGLARRFALIGPEAVMGIEINPLALELARVSVWIGEIQWRHRHGVEPPRDPVLKPLETVEHRDALLDLIGGEAAWPAADAIVGNPPFLGDKAMLGKLGEGYVTRLRTIFAGRVPGAADLVCFWFEKARAMIETGQARRAGLVATNSIRGGANRAVLDGIRAGGTLFEAWPDEPWVLDGAAVRVSLVCFGSKGLDETPRLDGREVPEIFADLTGGGADLTKARRLAANHGVCFEGIKKYGPFDVPGTTARAWLALPHNPNGRPNADVLRPWVNAMDVVRRSSDTWVVDFGSMSESEAALYEAPFDHARRLVQPARAADRNARTRRVWWQHERPRPDLRAALSGLTRCILTPVVAKHRIFVWSPTNILPANLLDVFARDDDTTFGILHSRFHELWTLRRCTWLGVGNDPRYTPSTTFETFPFPEGLMPDRPATAYADDPRAQAIARAARRLDQYRENWLNPADRVSRVPEVVPGYPSRLVPRGDKAVAILRKKTLTNLYNERPGWLVAAHRDLDAAVAAAYGWPADLTDDEVLERLLVLNLARPAAPATAKRRRVKTGDSRQLRFRFTDKQAERFQLESPSAGAVPSQRRRPRAPQAPRRQTFDRRQYHLKLVFLGGLTDAVRTRQAAASEPPSARQRRRG